MDPERAQFLFRADDPEFDVDDDDDVTAYFASELRRSDDDDEDDDDEDEDYWDDEDDDKESRSRALIRMVIARQILRDERPRRSPRTPGARG